jgi:hypothetical protein
MEKMEEFLLLEGEIEINGKLECNETTYTKDGERTLFWGKVFYTNNNERNYNTYSIHYMGVIINGQIDHIHYIKLEKVITGGDDISIISSMIEKIILEGK